MILKIKVWIKNILVATLAAAVIFGFTPQMEQPAYADATGVDFSSYVNTTTVFNFNGMGWYIIGDSSKGVRPEKGTVTLLSQKYMGVTNFNSSYAGNAYKTSTAKRGVDSYFSKYFKDVSPAIKSVDLTDVGVTGANLWLLSQEEAATLEKAVLYCENDTGHASQNDGWWLRTPYTEENKAFLVYDASSELPTISPALVFSPNGIRPALKLDLRNVDFDAETKTFTLVDSPVILHRHDNIEFSEWTDELAKTQNGEGMTASNSLPRSAGSYYLTRDVDLGSQSWKVPSGNVNLCLNGHSITSKDDDAAIDLDMDNRKLNIYDEHSGDSAGVISCEEGDGVLLEEESGTFNMYGGKISNCDDYGVNLDESDTEFNMYNGEISNCYGGVNADASSSVFTLHNGTIRNNTYRGVDSYGSTVIENGSVTNNKTGIYTYSSTKKIVIQGSNISPQITGNTEHNLLLNRNGDLKIQISDGTTISGDARIDVYPTNGTSPVTGIFTAGLSGKIQGNKTAADIFKSDDDGYFVSAAENGEAQLEKSEQPAVDPVGNIDVVAGKEGSIDVAGWAFDPSNLEQSIDVHVYIGDKAGSAEGEGHALTANLERADVDKVYKCGLYHGFSSNITTSKRGEQPVYVYAINIGEGKNVLLGTGTVTISEIQYPLNIDPGEGSGNVISTKVNSGAAYTFPECNFKEPEGKAFDHWEMTGVDGVFYPGSTVTIADNCLESGVITVTAYWKETTHVHDWSYTADGASITAKCNNPDCSIKSGLTMTITGPDPETLIYDGQKKEATLNTDYNATAFPENYEILYTGTGDTTYSSRQAPSEPGSYKASVTAGTGEKAVTAETVFVISQKPEPKPKFVNMTPKAMKAKGKRALTIAWSKAAGAEGYDIFFARCGVKKDNTKFKISKTIKGNKTFRWTKKKLKAKTAYKAYVKAWVKIDGKKKYIGKSPAVHAFTSNETKKYTNAKSVTVKKAKVSLKAGKTFRIKATVNKISKKKKLMPSWHVKPLRYMSSSTKIATVTKAGKIRAKAAGTCKIYVYAHNGVSRTVNVTVR